MFILVLFNRKMKAREVKKILGCTQTTLSKYVKLGKIRVTEINPWNYIYDDNDVYSMIGLKKHNRRKQYAVSYARVSNRQRNNDLKEQSRRIYEYCVTKGIDLKKQYEDIKSGMSFDREQFSEMIDEIIKGNINLVIVENKDRLARFGFELLEMVFRHYGCSIIVINDAIQNKSYEQEMSDDLISIIHYFSMKMYSHRRKLNRIKKELMEED